MSRPHRPGPPARGRRLQPTMPAKDLHQLISEASFQQQVCDLATTAGWWWHHEPDSRRSRAGLPDLLLIKPPRVVFAELKKERGRVRAKQAVVLELLGRCPGVESYLWRPSDWEQVKAVLTGRAPPGRAR